MAVVSAEELRQPLPNPQQTKAIDKASRAPIRYGLSGKARAPSEFWSSMGDAAKALLMETAKKIKNLYSLEEAKKNIALTMKKLEDIKNTRDWSPPGSNYGGLAIYNGTRKVREYSDSSAAAANKQELDSFLIEYWESMPKGEFALEKDSDDTTEYNSVTWYPWYAEILQELVEKYNNTKADKKLERDLAKQLRMVKPDRQLKKAIKKPEKLAIERHAERDRLRLLDKGEAKKLDDLLKKYEKLQEKFAVAPRADDLLKKYEELQEEFAVESRAYNLLRKYEEWIDALSNGGKKRPIEEMAPGTHWIRKPGESWDDVFERNANELREWTLDFWGAGNHFEALGEFNQFDAIFEYRNDPTWIDRPPGGEYVDEHAWRRAKSAEDALMINRAALAVFYAEAARNAAPGNQAYFAELNAAMIEALSHKPSPMPDQIYSVWTDEAQEYLTQVDLYRLTPESYDPLPLPMSQPETPFDPSNYFGASRDKLTYANERRRFSMNPIEAMIHSGPDWMSNKFDCFFVFVPNGKSKPEDDFDGFDKLRIPEWATPYERFLLNHRGFAVRVGEVAIPFMYNGDFSLPFLETQINKIKSTKVLKTDSHFTFRLDENLVWLDHIQMLAGRLNVLDDHVFQSRRGSPNSYVKSAIASGALGTAETITTDAYRKLFRTIAASWSTAAVRETAEKDAIRSFDLCLIVKMQHLSSFINTYSQQKMLPYFVFENIKILGTGDAITYDSSSPGQKEITVPFIFRRCYQISPGVGNVQYDGTPGHRDAWEKTTNQLERSNIPLVAQRGLPRSERLKRTFIPTYFSVASSLFWNSKEGPRDSVGASMAMIDSDKASIKGWLA